MAQRRTPRRIQQPSRSRVLAQEIVEDLEAALEQFREIDTDLAAGEPTTAARIPKKFLQTSKDSETALVNDFTAWEKKVLQLLATGLTNKEIGVRLDMAENTVKNHLKNILAKLHLQSRVQAATLATQQGMLTAKRSVE